MTKADLVFTQGTVHTRDPARTRASSLAVTGERISVVGHDEVRELIGPSTEVVDPVASCCFPASRLPGFPHPRRPRRPGARRV